MANKAVAKIKSKKRPPLKFVQNAAMRNSSLAANEKGLRRRAKAAVPSVVAMLRACIKAA
jgi:hypothetical protein